MNVAVGIVGVLLSILMFVQSALVDVGSSILESGELEGSAALGIVGAFLMLVASALAFDAPRLSPYPFLAAAAFAGVGAWDSEFSDLWFWMALNVTFAATTFAVTERHRAIHRRCGRCDELIRRRATACRHCGASTQPVA